MTSPLCCILQICKYLIHPNNRFMGSRNYVGFSCFDTAAVARATIIIDRACRVVGFSRYRSRSEAIFLQIDELLRLRIG